jgi:AcrR family transcriptional regulator
MKPTTEKGEISRTRILEAAFRLFAEQGYAATSVAQVCEAAGVAKTALYWHFDSKEGLLAAVLENTASAEIEAIQRAVAVEGEPVARLDQFMGHMRRLLAEQRGLLRLILGVALERSDADAGTRRALRSVAQRIRTALAQGLEDAVGDRVPEADLIAHTVLALLDGALLATLIDPKGTDLDRLLEHMRTTLVLVIGHQLERVGLDGRVFTRGLD